MIGYYFIVTVFLLYVHLTDAAYDTNEEQMLNLLSEEKRGFLGKLTLLRDFVCKDLRASDREALCEKMMIQMINHKKQGGELFQSFLETPSNLLTPLLAIKFEQRPHSYICDEVKILDLGLEKNVFWCLPKQYKKASGDTDQMEGFFCAGSLVSRGRTFAFRAPDMFSKGIKPVGQMYNNV